MLQELASSMILIL